MRLPRDISGKQLVSALARLGYAPTRQLGSHIRVTRPADATIGEHHVTIPAHDPIKIGTLNAILKDVALHLGLDRDEILRRLFG